MSQCVKVVSDEHAEPIPCGVETSIVCAQCGQPVCASCCEASWLAEASETCPDCWGGEA